MFSVALAIGKRNNDLHQYREPSNWADAEINDIMQRVEAYADPAAVGERDFMSTVTIELSDGRTLSASEIYPPGSPMNPATNEQLDMKVRSLSETAMGQAQADALIETVRNIEKIADVGALAALLVRRE